MNVSLLQQKFTRLGGISPAAPTGPAQQVAPPIGTAPIQVELCSDTHPDTALRRLGLIRQRIKFGTFTGTAVFDPVQSEWVNEDSRTPIEKFHPTAYDCDKKIDTVPNAILFVIGDLAELEESNFVQDDISVEERRKMRDLEDLLRFRERQFSEDPETARNKGGVRAKYTSLLESLPRLAQPSKRNLSSITELQAESEYLSRREVCQFIRQYFFRSVPAAALRAGAVIITPHVSGSLVDALSSGVDSINERNDVRALCVRSAGAPEEVNGFSHVLQLSDEVSSQKVLHYSHSVVTELSRGYHPSSNGPREPPSRPSIPTIVILAGGQHHTLKSTLLPCTSRGWPIFVIEGSGGIADELVSVYRAVHGSSKSAGTLDADFVDIVTRGRIFVVAKGELVDTFTQSLVYSLRGDETLRNAWTKYAMWSKAMRRYADIFQTQIFLILLLGVLATGLSIFQTFSQLMWPEEAGVKNSETDSKSSTIATLFPILNIVVIVLPIGMQLMQTFTNKVNAGSKWVALRCASEVLLSEIFMLRARVDDYSPEKVLEAARRVKRSHEEKEPQKRFLNEAAIKSNEKKELFYTTRQELLHQRLEALTNDLADVIADGAVLPPYTGPLPPKKMRFHGDDGFSDLTAQQYVDRRLLPTLTVYETQSRKLMSGRWVAEILIHVLNTAGAILGALSTHALLRKYNLQAWVTLTTAIVSSLTRYDSSMMMEYRQRKWNETWMRLTTVQSWWTSRGSHSADQSVRNDLAAMVETVIRNEVAEFKKQQKVFAEAAKKLVEDETKKMEEASEEHPLQFAEQKKAKEQQQVLERKFRDLNLASLSPEIIEAAVQDPSSVAGRTVKRILRNVNSELGDVVTAATKFTKQSVPTAIRTFESSVADFAAIANRVVDDVTGCLLTKKNATAGQIQRLLPFPVLTMIADPTQRSAFLATVKKTPLKDISEFTTCSSFIHIAEGVDKKLHQQFLLLPTRLLLEIIRLAVDEEMNTSFLDTVQNLSLSIADIATNRDELPLVIEELKMLSSVPWRLLDYKTLLMLINNKPKLAALGELKLRSLIRRVENLSNIPDQLKILAASVNADIAEIDVHNNILASSTMDRAEIADAVDMMKLTGCSLELLSTSTILGLVPPRLRRFFAAADPGIMIAMLRFLEVGLPMSRCVQCAIARRRDLAGRRRLEAIFCTAGRRERFAVACNSVDQVLILTKSKEFILRHMTRDFVDKQFIDDIRCLEGDELKSLLSSVRSTAKNSYVGRLFDQVGQESPMLNVADVLTLEEQVLFARRLKEFLGVNVREMPRVRILGLLAVREITEKLQVYSAEQLQCLVELLVSLQRSSIHSHVLQAVLQRGNNELKNVFARTLSPADTPHVVEQLLHVELEDLERFKDDRYPMEYLTVVSGAEAYRFLHSARASVEQASELIKMVQEEMYDAAGIELFRHTACEIRSEHQLDAFDAAFSLPTVRKDVLGSLRSLVATKKVTWKWIDHISCAKEEFIKYVSELNENERSLYQLLWELFGENLPQVLISIIANMMVRGALHMFHAVAAKIRGWSLLPIFPRLESRLALVPLIVELYFVRHMDILSDEFPRDKLFSVCRLDYPHLNVVEELCSLPNQMLRELLRTVIELVVATPSGQFFLEMYKDKRSRFVDEPENSGEMTRQEEIDFCVIASTIESHILINPLGVESNFDSFDHRVFMARKIEVRMEVLATYLQNEKLVKRAIDWPEAILDLLFMFFRTKPVYRARRLDQAEVQPSPGKLTTIKAISQFFKRMGSSGVQPPPSELPGAAVPSPLETDPEQPPEPRLEIEQSPAEAGELAAAWTSTYSRDPEPPPSPSREPSSPK